MAIAMAGWLFALGQHLWLPFPSAAAEENRPDAPGVSRLFIDGQPKTIAQLKVFEEQVRKTVEKVRMCTVGVSDGSGVVISRDGYVLTVAHISERAGRTVTVTFPDGRRVQAKTLGNDYGLDAGLVKIIGKGPWPHAEMGDSGQPKSGQWCLAMGYPISFDRDKPPLVRIGRVQRHDEQVIVTDCPIMGGDSGGPLFDLQGRVIGIGSRCWGPLSVNLYVPVDAYHKSWDRLAKSDDFNSLAPPAAFLGVTADLDAEDARAGRVVPGSAAEAAGIRAGDVIVKCGNREIATFRDLIRFVRKKKPGDEVKLEIRRGEETMTLTVILGKQEL